MLGFMAILATLSVAQGIVDVVVPAIAGGAPFAFLFEMTQRLGPGFLWAYVFVHNLGLACLVPGYGFVAARFEKKTRNRGLIGLLLAAAVVMSLLVGLQYLLTARERFDLGVALPLYLGEAVAVLALAIAGARELKGFIPTRRYVWSLITPLRALRAPLVASTCLLAVLTTVEAWVILT